MFLRTMDVELINRIINDPTVLPWVAPYGTTSVDMSEFIKNTNNICLASDGGCYLFEKKASGEYEVHSQFLPEYRGIYARDMAELAKKEMFSNTDCTVITTHVPDNNTAAKWFTRTMGFKLTKDAPLPWLTKDGPVAMLKYELRKEEWIKCQQQ